MQDACLEIDKFADDLKKRLEDTNEQLLFGVEKFTTRYGKLKDSIPLLTSYFHRFGWTFGGTITSQKGGHLQNISAGHSSRKEEGYRFNVKGISGRSVKSTKNEERSDIGSRYFLPTRRPPKGRRPHSLKANVDKGYQNAGKW